MKVSGLSADLKHNTEATAGLDDETRKLITRYRELFDTQRKGKDVKDIGPQLQRELIQAEFKLVKDDFDKRIELVKEEFAFRRAEYAKHAALTATQIDALMLLEVKAIQLVQKERLKADLEAVEASLKLHERENKEADRLLN